ncbi:DinB family protein [Paenibacillus sp. WLX1005]|uniref:DinB family protein n=1 Tax=Paenibacillus sp. WLX1005 TaxID=3243766 RepID=UPI0039841097
MNMLFEYNWQVRQDWFDWCRELPEEELLSERVGGMGSFLKTLFHIVEVEYNWMTDLKQQVHPSYFDESFEQYRSLAQVEELSRRLHPQVAEVVSHWHPELEDRELQDSGPDGQVETHTYGEVIRHVIAHEIHHIGQLSIWARMMDRKPVTANLIRRGLGHTSPETNQ